MTGRRKRTGSVNFFGGRESFSGQISRVGAKSKAEPGHNRRTVKRRPSIRIIMPTLPIKVLCGCGQKYAFEVEPVNGRMPSRVACPVCGADGTAPEGIR